MREPVLCYECRKITTYTLQKVEYKKDIDGVLRTFLLTAAICDNCGAEIGIPGIIDKNIEEYQSQLRKIRKLKNDYNNLVEK